MPVNIIKDLRDFIKEQWESPFGFAIALAALSISPFFLLDPVLKDIPFQVIQAHPWHVKAGVGALLVLVIFSYWLISRRYPKRDKDKIGILVAIKDDSELTSKIKLEVTEKLNEIIRSTTIGGLMQVLSLPNFRAKNVGDEHAAVKVSNKTDCQFVIYGRITNLGGQVEFNLSFTVRHVPLPPKQKRIIEQAFADSFVSKQWRYLEADALHGIRVTVDNIREICLYVVGIAAHQSYDFDVSRRLHEDLLTLLRSDPTKRAELSPVFHRLPGWIASSYTILALKAFFNENNLPEALTLNGRALLFDNENTAAMVNQALFSFEAADTKEAKRMISLLKRRHARGRVSDGGWRYSEAFLLLYEGKFERGLVAYKRAFATYTNQYSLNSVVEYLKSYANKFPDRLEFQFALAHVLIMAKGNLPMALDPLEKFFNGGGATRPEYVSFVDTARSYLQSVYEMLETPNKEKIAY